MRNVCYKSEFGTLKMKMKLEKQLICQFKTDMMNLKSFDPST